MLPCVGRVDRITTVCRATTATGAVMSMCRACSVPCACVMCRVGAVRFVLIEVARDFHANPACSNLELRILVER